MDEIKMPKVPKGAGFSRADLSALFKEASLAVRQSLQSTALNLKATSVDIRADRITVANLPGTPKTSEPALAPASKTPALPDFSLLVPDELKVAFNSLKNATSPFIEFVKQAAKYRAVTPTVAERIPPAVRPTAGPEETPAAVAPVQGGAGAAEAGSGIGTAVEGVSTAGAGVAAATGVGIPIAIGIGAVVALGRVAASAGSQLKSFGDRAEEAGRGLMASPSIAQAYAFSDLRNTLRDIKIGEDVAPYQRRLLDAVNDIKDAAVPISEAWDKGWADIKTMLIKIVEVLPAFTQIVLGAQAINKILDWLHGHEPEPDQMSIGETLDRIAQETARRKAHHDQAFQPHRF